MGRHSAPSAAAAASSTEEDQPALAALAAPLLPPGAGSDRPSRHVRQGPDAARRGGPRTAAQGHRPEAVVDPPQPRGEAVPRRPAYRRPAWPVPEGAAPPRAVPAPSATPMAGTRPAAPIAAAEPETEVPETEATRVPEPRPAARSELTAASSRATVGQRKEPRLLAGWRNTDRMPDLAEHHRRHGELPRAEFAGPAGAARLVELADRAGLRGRGGAGFPTARKMFSVLESASARRRPVLVANGCEGDPTSEKDRVLLQGAPHLVLDGIALAAHAVGADQAILCLHRGSPLVTAMERAVAERGGDPCEIHVVTVPGRFVSSEASALVRYLTEGDARPSVSPPLPSQRGVQGRPTLVDNVETLAHLALIARRDADWFRARGTEASPGTMLATVGGAVHRPGVYEVDLGARAGHLLRLAGGASEPVQALLLGGLGGSWLPLPARGNLALSHEACAAAGVGLGVASLMALPADACGLAVTSALVAYLAGESANQCGPCMFGLPSVAEDLAELAAGSVDPDLAKRLERRLGVVLGRGACAHPDGTVRLAASALDTFASDVAEHLRGRPCGRPDITAFPMLASLTSAKGGWR
ncbi:MAG TPA: NADH-ubiquinone oxidoreductase-F iron-sulfur binding region domain-containing protein [Pseudonocardia sp.]|uniref:NADH-ubiquinone oxidoreductase-F iron-sulfur binding region domain-containing protein n=1 Tax=Pseudonocardia sp. TaxID=60912 RepID=UPI002F42C223